MKIDPKDAAELLRAARELVAQHVGDYVNSVRDSEMKGWDGPLVTAWGEASAAMARVVSKYPAPGQGEPVDPMVAPKGELGAIAAGLHDLMTRSILLNNDAKAVLARQHETAKKIDELGDGIADLNERMRILGTNFVGAED